MNWMPVELTVEGSKTEGKRVYFRYLERTYTSDSFSGRYDLVGERAQGYVNIFDIREMEASILSTGEDLGRLFTRASWDQEPVSMRTAKLTARDCRLKNAQSTWQWQQDRAEKADGERKTKSGKDRNSRAAREVAKTMTTLDVQFERDGGIASQAPVPNREPAFWKSDRAPSKSVKRGAR